MLSFDWNATINTIRESLPPTQFQNWFKPVELLRTEDSSIVLGVPSRFHEEWLKNHYTSQITEAIRQQCGAEVQLEFEILVRDENWEASQNQGPTAIQALDSGLQNAIPGETGLLPFADSTIQPASKKALDTPAPVQAPSLPLFHHQYAEFSFNRVAHQCALIFVGGRDPHLNPLVLHGGVGMGKTHLLSLIGENLFKQNPSLRIRYTSSESFVHEYVRHLKHNDLFQFKRIYAEETDVLLFDDVHGLANKMKTQESLLHIFNDILARGGRVAFSTAVAPHQLENFLEPLKSRLLSGLTADIKPMVCEERVQLLGNLSEQNKIEIDPITLRTLADRGQKDVRELMGSLLRAHLQAQLENKRLDCTFLAEQPFTEKPQTHASIQEIIGLVEHHLGVSRETLTSKSRKGHITWARQVAMYLARSYTLLSLEEIGQNFDRDHATVIHAFQKVTDTMAEHATRKYEVEFLKKKLDER